MTTARRTGPLPYALAALAAGCGSSLGTPPCDGGSCGSQTSTKATVQYDIERRIDLLFVVDDTPAIAPYADRIAAAFAAMAANLQSVPLPMSLHVGFVRAGSCDTSTRGGACGVAASAPFVAMVPCNTITNASGTFVDTVACLGALGAADCGPIQPLAVAAQTLDPANASWAGFLRPDAVLDVVIVAASDDASGTPAALAPVADLARQLRAVKTDPSAMMVTVIGPGNCAATGDVHAPRLDEVVNDFGSNGLYMDLCSDPLSAAVNRLAEILNSGLPPPCLTNVRDTDPASPGLQPRCTLVERGVVAATGAAFEQVIPSCDDGPPPCWQNPAPGMCDGAPGWYLNLAGLWDQCFDGPISVDVECLGCADPNDPACAIQP